MSKRKRRAVPIGILYVAAKSLTDWKSEALSQGVAKSADGLHGFYHFDLNSRTLCGLLIAYRYADVSKMSLAAQDLLWENTSTLMQTMKLTSEAEVNHAVQGIDQSNILENYSWTPIPAVAFDGIKWTPRRQSAGQSNGNLDHPAIISMQATVVFENDKESHVAWYIILDDSGKVLCRVPNKGYVCRNIQPGQHAFWVLPGGGSWQPTFSAFGAEKDGSIVGSLTAGKVYIFSVSGHKTFTHDVAAMEVVRQKDSKEYFRFALRNPGRLDLQQVADEWQMNFNQIQVSLIPGVVVPNWVMSFDTIDAWKSVIRTTSGEFIESLPLSKQHDHLVMPEDVLDATMVP